MRNLIVRKHRMFSVWNVRCYDKDGKLKWAEEGIRFVDEE